ncbi:response regulator, partial [Salmonella enterica]|uniref:response regulator n=1 Tax=Salmonella enterica TaxID=28901 RepID=UPI0015CCB549
LLLIVEDNADPRRFIRETVESSYQVMEAVNGKEGLAKASAEIPDVIVSDVMMPLMDGFALAEKLKKDERTSHIPLILLTAKAGQSHKIEG